jgi:hypothetical protein
MVHKITDPKKRIAMAYRVYFDTKLNRDKWSPVLEQWEYLEDAKKNEWLIQKNPLMKKLDVRTKIVKERAEYTEMLERKMLEKIGLKKQSFARGFLESVNALW